MTEMGAGHYQASFPIGTRRGLFRVRSLEESRKFPETGIYLPEPELTLSGQNEKLMRDLAAWTGGVFNPSPQQIFRPPASALPASLMMWPFLLALALLFNLGEVAWRRFGRSGGARVMPGLARAA
jgi:hypothetical protein